MNIVISEKDTAIYYELSGRGYPLVLLHGQYMNSTMFDTFDQEFGEDYQLIKIDLRGHGYSDKPLHINLDDYISDVLSVLDELYVKKAHFLGYGLGGMVAQAIAIRYPHLVQRLVLVSVGNEPFNDSEERFHLEFANLLRTMKQKDQDKLLAQYMYHDRKTVERWKRRLKDTETTMTNLERKAVNYSTEDVDLLSQSHLISAPALVVSGEHDHIIRPDHGRTLSEKIPNATYMLFENSGHAPMIEEKDRFVQNVKIFLAPELDI
ncbi:alpha/beta hydrolase [Macrococcus equipercicus]|uniref:Alpha/beta hydrolase n=1 Tax=Macrococcus equipercicus TaxID=69967 RepID=A0ABQ6R8A0_9STAP|nr:alpha/beta hydrolase [Macrococcus equipercicus]KAA1039340.1 alpha/beta hydrolase [Macrococcus equipercicus]